MTFLNYLRVFIVSFEFLFFMFFIAVLYWLSPDTTEKIFTSLDSDAKKWVMLYPFLMAGWNLKEAKLILFPTEKQAYILRGWPDYNHLKIHLNIGIFNCLFYTFICFLMWAFNLLDTHAGFWFFIASVIALSINALTFYLATIEIKSILFKSRDLDE